MSIQSERSFLESKLDVWAKSKSPQVPVAYENMTFAKPTSGAWVECFVIPSTTFNREVSAVHYTDVGTFQINVWTPAGIGMGSANNLADEIRGLYKPGIAFQGFSIESTPSIGKAIDATTGWVILPVMVKYRQEN